MNEYPMTALKTLISRTRASTATTRKTKADDPCYGPISAARPDLKRFAWSWAAERTEAGQ